MNFTNFWFKNPKYWFSSTPSDDQYILSLFDKLLDKSELIKQFNSICKKSSVLNDCGRLLSNDKIEFYNSLDFDFVNINIDISKKQEVIDLILICDQLSRHKYRQDLIKLQDYDSLASKLVEIILNNPVNRQQIFDKYSPEEKCFIMLPFRHSNNLDKNLQILKIVKDLRKEADCPIYRRFYKATLLRIGKIKNIIAIKNPYKLNPKISIDKIIEVLDDKSYQNIGEYDFARTREFDEEPIVRTFKKFLEKEQINNQVNNMTISLSGGVDSMVSSFILRYLQNQFNINIVAVHIDYNNRDSSCYEAEMCAHWCQELQIPLYIRKIDEISRNRDKDRDLYEKTTRYIRYGMYEYLDRPVIIGHNRDDSIENIFSNIIREQNFDNLFGMNSVTQDVVKICRPMMTVFKDDIYYFAEKYKIPFVYDSTPEWSERGQKRDKLIPFLNDFDQRIIPGMENLAAHIKGVYNVYDDFITSMVKYNVAEVNLLSRDRVEVCDIDKKIIKYGEFVLHDILVKICSHYKIPYFNRKTIKNCFRILNSDNKITAITLNLYIRLIINDDNYQIVVN